MKLSHPPQTTAFSDIDGKATKAWWPWIDDLTIIVNGLQTESSEYDLSQIEADIDALQASDASQNSTISTHTTQISALQSSDNTQNVQIGGLTNQVNLLNTNVNTLNINYNAINVSVNDHEVRITNLENFIDDPDSILADAINSESMVMSEPSAIYAGYSWFRVCTFDSTKSDVFNFKFILKSLETTGELYLDYTFRLMEDGNWKAFSFGHLEEGTITYATVKDKSYGIGYVIDGDVVTLYAQAETTNYQWTVTAWEGIGTKYAEWGLPTEWTTETPAGIVRYAPVWLGITGSTPSINIQKALIDAINLDGQTASRALVLNAGKDIVSSVTTLTELSYVNGVTSAIQTQLNGKEPLLAPLWEDIKDFTGWVNPDGIAVSYDSSTRKITLTGDLRYRYQSVLNELTSPWLSDAHATTLDTSYFLRFDGANFVFDTTPWVFSELQLAYVEYGTNYKFAIREVHGFMPHECHKSDHLTIGTYRLSGLGLTAGTYAINGTTDAENRPGIDEGVLRDEDLETLVQAFEDGGTYTTIYGNASNDAVITTGVAGIVPIGTTYPQYNNAGTLTELANNRFMNVYLIAMPVTTDAGSQAYRHMWCVGSFSYTTKTSAEAESPQVNVGNLSTLSPEYDVVYRLTLKTSASLGTNGKFQIVAESRIGGSRANPIAIGGTGTSDHNALSNLQLAGTGVTYGHIDDQAQTIAGNKTLSGNTTVGVATTNSHVITGSTEFSHASSTVGHIVTRESTGTNAATGTLQLRLRTTADMADGFGPTQVAIITDNAGVDNLITSIQHLRSGADNSGLMRFRVANAGTFATAIEIAPNTSVTLFGSLTGTSMTMTGNCNLGDAIDDAHVITGTTRFSHDNATIGHLISRDGTANTTVRVAVQVRSTTSNDMADGFGTGLNGIIADNAGVDNVIGAIQFVRSGADNSGIIRFRSYSAGTASTALDINPDKSIKLYGTVGFNNTNPISKPTVTGSRGSNAALASLLTALANYGLVTDSTT